MRSLIVATVLLAAVANAFVDFTGMSGSPKKSVHPETGNIHYEHDVHHQFGEGESKTFFKAKYAAEHEAHWNIIQLHEHIEGMEGVGCELNAKGSIHQIGVVNPSASLLEQLHAQKATGYSHTIITAAPHHQCEGKKQIFKLLASVETDSEDGSIMLRFGRSISYNHVFKNLDFQLDTDHIHQRSARGPKNPTKHAQIASAKPMSMNAHFLQRGMSTQGWFHHLSHKIEEAAHEAAERAEADARAAAERIAEAAEAVKERAEEIAAHARALAAAAAEKLKEAAEEVAEKAKEVAEAAAKKVEEAQEWAKEEAEKAAAKAKAIAEAAAKKAEELKKDAEAKAKQVEEDVAAKAKKVAEAAKKAAEDVGKGAKWVAAKTVDGVKYAGHEVVKAAKDVVKVTKAEIAKITTFDIDHTFNLPGLNWNKDISKTFSQWDMTISETLKLAASFSFHPSFTLKIKVVEFHLHDFEAYFTGVTQAGVTGSFSIDVQDVIGGSKCITTIKIHDITFSIGPVPVIIKPSIPIYAGFDVAFDADFTVNAVVSAKSSITFGYGYSPKTGLRHISDHEFKFVHDFGPMDYSISIGVGVYVQAVLSVTIEDVAEVQVGARIQADAILESNDDCLIALNINAQPAITLNAGISLDLLHHNIFSHDFGPYTLWTKKIPLYNYCKPQKASVKKFLGVHGGSWDSSGALGRHMEQQSSGRVITVSEKKLTQNHIGKSWSGTSESLQNGYMINMHYGAQFLTGVKVNSSQMYFTIALTQPIPGVSLSHNGKAAATATMVYECDSLPEVGAIMNYTLVYINGTSYNQATNKTVLNITPSKTMLLKVSKEDVRFVELEADMVYGTIAMVSPPANNGTSSFTIFRDGGGRLEVAGMDLTKADTIGILVYALVATFAAVVAIITAIVCYRKFRAVRRTVEVLEAKENDTGLIQNAAPAEASVELQV